MKTENTASKHIEELSETVFGEPQPVSDFERKCQALRGWRIGDIAIIKEYPEEFQLAEVVHVACAYPEGRLCVHDHKGDSGDFWPSELINLSRP